MGGVAERRGQRREVGRHVRRHRRRRRRRSWRPARRAPASPPAAGSGPYSTSDDPRSGPAGRELQPAGERGEVAARPGVERPVVVGRRARSAPPAGVAHAGAPAAVNAGTITATWSRSGVSARGEISRPIVRPPRRPARRGRRAPSPRAGGRRAPTAAGGRSRRRPRSRRSVPTSRTSHGRSALPCGRSTVWRQGRSGAPSSAYTALSISTLRAPGDG